MNFIKCNNITLHFSDQGPKYDPAIVFSNSLGTDLRIWEAVVADLSVRFRCIRYDQRGHGLSQATEPPYSLADHVADLYGLLQQLRVHKVIIVGLSVGGMIAQQFAVEHADTVQGLVLCDTAGRIGPPQNWTKRIEAIKTNGLPAISETIVARWCTPELKLNNPGAFTGLRQMLAATSTDGYLGTCAALRDADLTETSKMIAVPTLCLCGAEDTATTPDQVRALAALIPEAEFQLIANAAHLPCVEQPQVLVRKIGQFIEEKILAANPVKERFESGMSVRRSVLGDAHVDRTEQNKTDFDADFQRMITEVAWGSVWARAGLSRRERSLLTIAMLAALGHEEELALHIRATQNTGATENDIKEVLMQVAVYAGVPAANSAIRIAKEVFRESEVHARKGGQ